MSKLFRLGVAGAVTIGIGAASNAMAAPTVDGSVEAGYGAAKASQLVGTQFGNNTNPTVNVNNGSELDNAYGVVDSGTLYIFLGGNLETNFNKLEIFIDSVAGGQNKLRGDNPNVDFNGLNRMGDDGSGNGLRFDTGFESDYYLTTTGGGGPTEFFANFAETPTAGGGAGGFIGGSGPGNTLLNGSNGIVIGYNLSNILGVNSFGNADDSPPASVPTGIEVSIPLSLLGNPTGPIKISAFVNGGAHDFLSNQIMGPVALGTGNLGEPRAVNFDQFAGNQYFVVDVPEPGTLGLMNLAGLAMLARRRGGAAVPSRKYARD